MPEEAKVTPVTPVAGNDPLARTETGEIKDQQTPTTSETKSTSTPETKTEVKTETKVEEKTDAKTQAPEKYEFKAPEGQEFDEKFVIEASTAFKELGLSQDQAQSLVTLYAKKAMEQGEAPYKAYNDMRSEWRTSVFKDPALGDGSNIKPEVKALINSAINSLGDAKLATEFKEAMDLTGAGDHPAFVKAFYNLAKLLPREGSSVRGSGPAVTGQRAPGEAPKSAAQALYPNLNSSAG